MKRVVGRNIYITSLSTVLAKVGDVSHLAELADKCHFKALWLRLGRGKTLDANFSGGHVNDLRAALDRVGVELWGWHVPFCANQSDAAAEGANVSNWAEQFNLGGVIIDAERTNESPRFRGHAAEATTYMTRIAHDLSAHDRGLALSSHDQPSLHTDLPFEPFLSHVNDNCPQVYYRTENIITRLDKSVHDYKIAEGARNFQDRYRPTGNVTVKGDIPFSSVHACLAATRNFITAVDQRGYGGYSFWCMDEAPKELWPLLEDLPPAVI